MSRVKNLYVLTDPTSPRRRRSPAGPSAKARGQSGVRNNGAHVCAAPGGRSPSPCQLTSTRHCPSERRFCQNLKLFIIDKDIPLVTNFNHDNLRFLYYMDGLNSISFDKTVRPYTSIGPTPRILERISL